MELLNLCVEVFGIRFIYIVPVDLLDEPLQCMLLLYERPKTALEVAYLLEKAPILVH